MIFIMAKYVIRELVYYYNDEYESELCEGAIQEVFDNKEEAITTFNKKEISTIKSRMLYITAPIANNSGDEAIQQKVHDYFVENFNMPLISEQHGYKGIHEEFEIPDYATDEQILEIKDIAGLRFHTLAEFSSNIVFYIVKYDGELVVSTGYDWQNDLDIIAPYFYNTKEEALMGIPSKYYKTTGKIEDLIETPSILEHYIATCGDVNYNNETKELSINFSLRNRADWEKQRNLLMILRNSPIVIEEISLEEAQSFDNRAYYSM
jgi:hypothetical protein